MNTLSPAPSGARPDAAATYQRFVAERRASQRAALRNWVSGEERAMQRLDVEIAEHARLSEDLTHLTGWEVMTWRTADTRTADGKAQRRAYDGLLNAHITHSFWDSRDREAESDARYYRLATLWTRAGVAALLLGLAVLAVAHLWKGGWCL